MVPAAVGGGEARQHYKKWSQQLVVVVAVDPVASQYSAMVGWFGCNKKKTINKSIIRQGMLPLHSFTLIHKWRDSVYQLYPSNPMQKIHVKSLEKPLGTGISHVYLTFHNTEMLGNLRSRPELPEFPATECRYQISRNINQRQVMVHSKNSK